MEAYIIVSNKNIAQASNKDTVSLTLIVKLSSSADYPFTTIACELFAVNQSYHTLLVKDRLGDTDKARSFLLTSFKGIVLLLLL